jgi:formylglycine-generating enzyme required for sulfatase activity
LTFDEALVFAESVGKRLPTEAEYEFVATGGGTRAFPWGDVWPQGAVWEIGPVGQSAVDRLEVQVTVRGLWSNVAEWTDSWPIEYPVAIHGADGRRDPRTAAALAQLSRVVRGGPRCVIEGRPERELGPRSREAADAATRYPGVGFRCARSARPRFLD